MGWEEDRLTRKTGLKLGPERRDGLEQAVRNVEESLGRESDAASNWAGQPGQPGQGGSTEKGSWSFPCLLLGSASASYPSQETRQPSCACGSSWGAETAMLFVL